MSPTTLRTILAALFFVHAIGHAQGVLVSLGMFSSEKWHARSWFFDSKLGEKWARNLALLLWGLGMLGFLAAAFAFVGILFPQAWWRNLAIFSAIPSLLALLFYPSALAQWFNKIGAVGVDAAILISLLLLDWPSSVDLGF